MNFYEFYQILNENFFQNFNYIDKIITQDHSKEIYNLLLGMFPNAKKAIDYQYNDEDKKPFAEWRKMIFEIDNYVLFGPKIIDSNLIHLDDEINKERQNKFDQYIKDKQEGKFAQYFRNNDSDPRTIDFSKLPPITVEEEGGVYNIVDGAHRAFLAKKSNNSLTAYVWKKQKNNHPNSIKIKSLFNITK